MNENFLLSTSLAASLYHEVAQGLPIIDYHNHLPISELAADAPYRDLGELWVNHDPYKHRAMRICGVPERITTGRETDSFTRFLAWAETFPKLVGNPLYAWSVLELERVFGISEPLNPQTAPDIWNKTTRYLEETPLSPSDLLRRFGVKKASPCACLTEDLTPFEEVRRKFPDFDVAPSLRGDGMLENDRETLLSRLDAFHAVGCRVADHALDSGANDAESPTLRFLLREYRRRGWVCLLHLGAFRKTNTRLRTTVGPACGCAGIGKPLDVEPLVRLLDDVEQDGGLPKTVLFTLNPADDAVLATLTGSFPEDGVPGKIQFGPAWWYNDHFQGMRHHFESLAAHGVLSTFVGMTTDARSFLSFVRHEYFRRVFCGWVSEKVEQGVFPDDRILLDPLVRGVCGDNAAAFFS